MKEFENGGQQKKLLLYKFLDGNGLKISCYWLFETLFFGWRGVNKTVLCKEDTYVHRRCFRHRLQGPCNQQTLHLLHRRLIFHLELRTKKRQLVVCENHLCDLCHSPKAFKLCSNSARSIVPSSCLSYNFKHSMKSSKLPWSFVALTY